MTVTILKLAVVAWAGAVVVSLAALSRALRKADDAAAWLLADDPDRAPRHPSQRLYVPDEWVTA